MSGGSEDHSKVTVNLEGERLQTAPRWEGKPVVILEGREHVGTSNIDIAAVVQPPSVDVLHQREL